MSYRIYDEVTGVFTATLIEDMVKTVVATKRNFINCRIDDFFDVKFDYPLVYVPSYFSTIPLYEGDSVVIYFNQNKLRYPVLWKVLKPYGEGEITDSIDGFDVRFIQKICPEAFVYGTTDGLSIQVKNHLCINGKNNWFVTWKELDEALKGLIQKLNSHTHPGVRSGDSSTSPVTPEYFSLDISESKSKYALTSNK